MSNSDRTNGDNSADILSPSTGHQLPGGKSLAAFNLGMACPMLRYSQIYAQYYPDWPRAWSGVATSCAWVDESLTLLSRESDSAAVDKLRTTLGTILSTHHRLRLLTVESSEQASEERRELVVREECGYEEATIHAAHILNDQSRLKSIFWLGDSCGRYYLSLIEQDDDVGGLRDVLRFASLLPDIVIVSCETIQQFVRLEQDLEACGALGYLRNVLGKVVTDVHGSQEVVTAFGRFLAHVRAELAALADDWFLPPDVSGETSGTDTLQTSTSHSAGSQVGTNVTSTSTSTEPQKTPPEPPAKLGHGLRLDYKRRIVSREGLAQTVGLSHSKLLWAIVERIAGNHDVPVSREALTGLWDQNGVAKNPADGTVNDAINGASKALKPLGLQIRARKRLGWLISELEPSRGKG